MYNDLMSTPLVIGSSDDCGFDQFFRPLQEENYFKAREQQWSRQPIPHTGATANVLILL